MDKEQIECITIGLVRKPLDIDSFKEYLESLFGGSFIYYKQIVYHYKPDPTESLFGKGIRVIYNEDSANISTKVSLKINNEVPGHIELGKANVLLPEKLWDVDYIGYKQDEVSEQGKNVKILVYRSDSSHTYDDPRFLMYSLGFRYDWKNEEKIEDMEFVLSDFPMHLCLILREKNMMMEEVKETEIKREIFAIKIRGKASLSKKDDIISCFKSIITKLRIYADFYQEIDEKHI